MKHPLPAYGLAVLVLSFFTACNRTVDAPLFVQLPSSQTGITFSNVVVEDDSLYNPLLFDYIYNGAGVGVGDVNNDTLPDVFFAGNRVSNRLYLNRGNLRFEDVTKAAGLHSEGWSTGVAMVDINADGLLDIYVCVGGSASPVKRRNKLYINQGLDDTGQPTFLEQAEIFGLADPGYSIQAAFFDYDLDGDLDMYLLTNALEDSPNAMRPIIEEPSAQNTDRLYQNQGDGAFIEVSEEAGIVFSGYGLGVVVTDIDQDGWPDVYVANDYLPNDLLWRNNGDGTFTNVAGQYLKHQSFSGMGADVADVNNDARPDIFVADMLPPDNVRQKTMIPASNYEHIQSLLALGYEPQYNRNTLQLNNGPGPGGYPRFSEIGLLAGVHATDWSWASLFADFDNDSYNDLLVTNGFPRDIRHLDFITSMFAMGIVGTPAVVRQKLFAQLDTLPEIRLPNYLFRNRGDLTFEDVTVPWGLDAAGFSYGAAYGDLDRDGDLDIVINNLNEEAFLFENRSDQRPGSHYLRLTLSGPSSNPAGYGARITVLHGDTLQYREVSPYRGYQSSVEPGVHFGLGPSTLVDTLVVRWPDGRIERRAGIPADRTVVLDYGRARIDASPRRRPWEPKQMPQLVRETAAQYNLQARHEDTETLDFRITATLPHKHSQYGPGLAVGDVNTDGLADVFFGGDLHRASRILIQDTSGQYVESPIREDAEFEDMGALFIDFDRDRDLDLYVVSGGNQAAPVAAENTRRSTFDANASTPGKTLSEPYQDRLYVNDGTGSFRRLEDALPASASSGAAVAASDFDEDGDFDLFVGGRISPERYPRPPRSYLLRNDTSPEGAIRFDDVTADLAAGLSEIGLITSVLWSDYDADHDFDLILAGEWMPITIFRNDGGRFTNVTAEAGLENTSGWWNSLAAGDFDADNDIDYVAGNLGLNAPFQASLPKPVRVYAADFDNNGHFDPVITQFYGDEQYLIHPRAQLIQQIRAMERRFPSYTRYAAASFEAAFSSAELQQAYVAESVRFASSYLENRGDGTFAVHALPVRAQFAPIYGMQTGDFDGDGNLDVLFAGNFYGADVQTGRYDASVGGLLKGDGNGAFRFVDYAETGFFVDGDARAMAELLLDERRSLILVAQNDDSLRVFSRALGADSRFVEAAPSDRYALLTMRDGRIRRQEFYHGSGYLSQSSRYILFTPHILYVDLFDEAGRRRRISEIRDR